MSELLALIVIIAVAGGLVMLGFWVFDTLGIPDPINRVGKVLLVVIAVVVILARALPLAGIAF